MAGYRLIASEELSNGTHLNTWSQQGEIVHTNTYDELDFDYYCANYQPNPHTVGRLVGQPPSGPMPVSQSGLRPSLRPGTPVPQEPQAWTQQSLRQSQPRTEYGMRTQVGMNQNGFFVRQMPVQVTTYNSGPTMFPGAFLAPTNVHVDPRVRMSLGNCDNRISGLPGYVRHGNSLLPVCQQGTGYYYPE